MDSEKQNTLADTDVNMPFRGEIMTETCKSLRKLRVILAVCIINFSTKMSYLSIAVLVPDYLNT